MTTFLLRDRNATLVWGEALGRLLRAGDVVALVGDLGVGKTTLTQGIARGLGITAPVTSPTFTLVQEYSTVDGATLFHFDPYRLDAPGEAADFGFDEYFERGGVVVVEWADKVTALLPPDRLTLRLTILDDTDERADTISTPVDDSTFPPSQGVDTNSDCSAGVDVRSSQEFPPEADAPRRLTVEPVGSRCEALARALAAAFPPERSDEVPTR